MTEKDVIECALTDKADTLGEACEKATAISEVLDILPSVRAALVLSGYKGTALETRFYAATIGLKESFGLSLDKAERKWRASQEAVGMFERSLEHERARA